MRNSNRRSQISGEIRDSSGSQSPLGKNRSYLLGDRSKGVFNLTLQTYTLSSGTGGHHQSRKWERSLEDPVEVENRKVLHMIS